MIKEIDKDHKGKIHFADFLSLMALSLKEQTTEEDIIQAFKVFDPENTGIIKADKLRLIMMNLGEKLTDAEIDELIREADKERNEKIDYERFVNILMSKWLIQTILLFSWTLKSN